MDEYRYSPLEGPNNIRLLHILPGSNNESISAHLQEVALSHIPTYNALSYVWGTHSPNYPLYLDGKKYSIRKNLFQALQRVRQLGVRTVWVDAVCINQSDLEEQAQQVLIMRHIYGSAKCVIVHLGERTNAAQFETMFSDLERLARWWLQLPQAQRATTVDLEYLRRQYGLPSFDHESWLSLVHLADHKWFQRAWTFQEILTAKVCLLVSGNWQQFSNNVLLVFCTLYGLGLSSYIDRIPKMRLSGIDLAGQRCQAVLKRQEVDPNSLLLTWQPSPLIQLLRDSRCLEATRPCDLVYALLGVSIEENEEALKPDYNESREQTFTRVAQFFVQQGHGAQLLENTCLTTSNSTLASWIPQWDDKDFYQVIPYITSMVAIDGAVHTSKVFDASSKSKEAFHLSGDHVLVGQGIIFDTIANIGSAELLVRSSKDRPQGGPNGPIAIKSTMQYLNEICKMLLESRRDISDITLLMKGICDIATCGRQGRDEQITPGFMQKGLQMALHLAHNYIHMSEVKALQRILTAIPWPDDTHGNRLLAHKLVLSACQIYQRCQLCYTQKGHIGQVLPNARVGDKIAVLKGCEVPYVLREVGDELHCLVSNCYIHGIMYGEAWPCQEAELYEIRLV